MSASDPHHLSEYPAPGGRPPPGRLYQGTEAALFVLVGIVVMVLPLWLPAGEPQFSEFVISQGARDLLLVTLVFYLLRRSGEGLQGAGLHARGLRRDVLLGLGLFLPFYFSLAVLQSLLSRAGVPGTEGPPGFLVPDGGGDLVLALVFLIIVAVTEEVIFRGYLLRRLSALLGSPGAGAVLSSALFALGHGYQGWAGILAVWVIGMFFSGLVLWRRSLVAPIVMHFLQNFAGVVLVPLLYPDLTG